MARPGEQGAADGRSAAQRVKDACRSWRAGEQVALWKEATGESKVQKRRGRRKKQQEAPSLSESNARRASWPGQPRPWSHWGWSRMLVPPSRRS